MNTYLYLLVWILSAEFVAADSCTTSTISLDTHSATAVNGPSSTDGVAQISLEVTGCDNPPDFSGLTAVARINLYKNSFTELNLTGLRITDQIRIADNPYLEALVLPDPKLGQTVPLPPTGTDAPQWTDVEIVDNPRLDSDNITYQGSSNFWLWGAQNLSSLTISGSNIHSNFFYPQTTSTGKYPDESRVYTTTKFELNSTDSMYDCSYLNALRYEGLFKGEYTCQGRTVVPSAAFTITSPLISLVGGLVTVILLTYSL
ncbi:hypothetical protein F5Y04DRAFT_255481 [Hypomontagnella monticulosa]|nr:hypothetical protein F5Y04DRAFT_255481 [Hypomontagnella monticulosa]